MTPEHESFAGLTRRNAKSSQENLSELERELSRMRFGAVAKAVFTAFYVTAATVSQLATASLVIYLVTSAPQ